MAASSFTATIFLPPISPPNEARPPALARLVDRYGIGWAVLQAQSPAVATLERLPGWRRVYADDIAVVEMRNN